MKNTKSQEFNNLISEALTMLYRNDKYLIDHHANERAIVFRFGIYFQVLLNKYETYKDYNLDIEYNRNLDDPKRTPNHKNGIYPDLILHKRGNNNFNLLVIEFKCHWNNQGQEKDKSKIGELMSPNGIYNYKEGYTIRLEKEEPSINSYNRI